MNTPFLQAPGDKVEVTVAGQSWLVEHRNAYQSKVTLRGYQDDGHAIHVEDETDPQFGLIYRVYENVTVNVRGDRQAKGADKDTEYGVRYLLDSALRLVRACRKTRMLTVSICAIATGAYLIVFRHNEDTKYTARVQNGRVVKTVCTTVDGVRPGETVAYQYCDDGLVHSNDGAPFGGAITGLNLGAPGVIRATGAHRRAQDLFDALQ